MATASQLWFTVFSSFIAFAVPIFGSSSDDAKYLPKGTYPPNVKSVVDGATTPNAIPDGVAYAHFFGVLAKVGGVSDADNDARRRSYLQFYFRNNCGATKAEDRSLTEAQVTRLLTYVDDLSNRLAVINKAIDDSSRSGLSRTSTPASQVRKLFQDRENAYDEATRGLPTVVGADGALKIARHVLTHVKAHVKVVTVNLPAGGMGGN